MITFLFIGMIVCFSIAVYIAFSKIKNATSEIKATQYGVLCAIFLGTALGFRISLENVIILEDIKTLEITQIEILKKIAFINEQQNKNN